MVAPGINSPSVTLAGTLAEIEFAIRYSPFAASRRARHALAERGLRGGEARDRHAEGRARHVVEPDAFAEVDRGGIAAMLAADSKLDARARLASALGGDPHEFAHAFLVERHERIGRQDALGCVGAEERSGVVARDAERRLREVVGAEGE